MCPVCYTSATNNYTVWSMYIANITQDGSLHFINFSHEPQKHKQIQKQYPSTSIKLIIALNRNIQRFYTYE